MKTRSLLRLLAGAALTLSTLVLPALGAAAWADTLDDIRKAGKIRVAIDVAIPPFGMTDDKMQPTGSDVDLARLLAKDLGVQLEIVTTTGPTRIPMLQTNKADIVISTLSITPERAKVVDFSVPYADHPSVVGALKTLQIKQLSDLDGKKVAVVRGTTQDTDLTQKAKGAQLVRYEDDATMALAVASGQADILATARSLLPAISKKNPARTLEPKITMQTNYLAIGLRKDEPKLLAWINDWVRTNLKNGKLGAIYKQYHGVDIPVDELLTKTGG
ncbi:transporter substrate-binding domain-containing protein [soil metagenome]